MSGVSPGYLEVAPPAALRESVRQIWRYQSAAEPAPPVQVLPDGCVDLIWNGSEVFVAGPDRVAQEAALLPGSRLIGLRLAPGAALALLRAPLHELCNQRVPLRLLWGAGADALESDLLRDPACAGLRLAHAVAARSPTRDPAMAHLFERLASGQAPRLGTLVRELGMSERVLRRRSQAHFGYGAKTLDRILRLQRLLREAPHARTLTDAAMAAGYADAAHLVHDARDLTGLAPRELVRRHVR
ncbi:MAG TPA: DUF6597 domain-containing transcriptional factor [Stenotrophomonas sp.]|jgi:AraC-like DNA-binding protein